MATFFNFEAFYMYSEKEFAVAMSTDDPFRWITAGKTSPWCCICQNSEFHMPFELFNNIYMIFICVCMYIIYYHTLCMFTSWWYPALPGSLY
jgi:hypothetical protein